MAEVKFPTEVVDLPSKGLLYPKENPLSSGQIEVKYMTAKEEDILTSANLIKSGVVVEKLLESLIVDKSICLSTAVFFAYGEAINFLSLWNISFLNGRLK